MAPERCGIGGETRRPISYSDSFGKWCDQIIKIALHAKYDETFPSNIVTSRLHVSITKKEDQETLSLLQNGILPMPPASHHTDFPNTVWHLHACFVAYPNLSVDLWVGEFSGTPAYACLGNHDGHNWT